MFFVQVNENFRAVCRLRKRRCTVSRRGPFARRRYAANNQMLVRLVSSCDGGGEDDDVCTREITLRREDFFDDDTRPRIYVSNNTVGTAVSV